MAAFSFDKIAAVNPLKKLFGPKISPFLLELGAGHLWVVSLNQSNAGFKFGDAPAQALSEAIRRNAQETAGDQERRLFEYQKNGRPILPVFSSMEAVQAWIQRKPFALPDSSEMFAFTTMRIQTLVLFDRLRHLPAATYVLLDPETGQERELMPVEMRQTLEHFRR